MTTLTTTVPRTRRSSAPAPIQLVPIPYSDFMDLRPDSDGSIWLLWSSIADKTYAIERSEDLGTGFTILQTAIPATPGTNTFHDATATGVGPYFYRLTVE